MGDKSAIEWTEATWNPLVGCRHVSAGCDGCYAAREASGRLSGHDLYRGLAVNGRFTGEVRTVPERLNQPLHWSKARRVFVNSMSDLFHSQVPAEFIADVFAVMRLASQHTFQVLPAATFTHWDCNLRAVALTLEHLRAVDRYGVTTGGEQYRGWMGELGAGPATGLGRFTRITAAEWMAHALNGCGVPINDVNIVLASPRSMYRTLARHLHPDHGGSDDDMATLNAAYQAITGAPAAAGDHVSVTGTAP